ncbi:transposase [Azospirillum brasilense]|nr:transposase [Azospirillum brasilense]
MEVITGDVGRRTWSPEEKARILAEAAVPGAVVSEVARRHGLRPQQVFGWRRDPPPVAAAPRRPTHPCPCGNQPAWRRPEPAPRLRCRSPRRPHRAQHRLDGGAIHAGRHGGLASRHRLANQGHRPGVCRGCRRAQGHGRPACRCGAAVGRPMDLRSRKRQGRALGWRRMARHPCSV